jgi:hypothetical protein
MDGAAGKHGRARALEKAAALRMARVSFAGVMRWGGQGGIDLTGHGEERGKTVTTQHKGHAGKGSPLYREVGRARQ